MTREFQIWICPECDAIMGHEEDDEGAQCTGDGCSTGPWIDMDYPITEGRHKALSMDLIKVREIEEPSTEGLLRKSKEFLDWYEEENGPISESLIDKAQEELRKHDEQEGE